MQLSCFIILLLFLFGACDSTSLNTKATADSCKGAVPFENTKLTESMVEPGFTGELKNYWGEDTSKLDFKHFFKNGKLVKSYFYYENGHIQEEYEYMCKAMHGIQKYYYPNGHIAKIVPYRFGRIEGMAEMYDENGILRQQVLFKADSIIEQKKFDILSKETKN